MQKVMLSVFCSVIILLFSGTEIAQTLPKAIYKTNEAAEDLYDYAGAGNLSKVKLKINELNNLYGQYRKDAEENRLTPQLLDFYSLYIYRLNEELKSKDFDKIAFSANQITGIGSAFDNHFKTKIPGEISRLDYLGRELLLESKTKNIKAINRRLSDIDYIWKSIKSLVLNMHGKKQSVIFEKIVAEIKVNKTEPGSGMLTGAIDKYLEQIDNLEKLF